MWTSQAIAIAGQTITITQVTLLQTNQAIAIAGQTIADSRAIAIADYWCTRQNVPIFAAGNWEKEHININPLNREE